MGHASKLSLVRRELDRMRSIYDITSRMDSFQAIKHFYAKRKLQLLSIAIDGCIEKQETPREGRKRYEKIG